MDWELVLGGLILLGIVAALWLIVKRKV